MFQLTRESQPVLDDPYATCANLLGEALLGNAMGRERRWATSLDTALADIEIALRNHLAAEKDSGGTLAEVDDTRPSIARQADHLRNQQGELLTAVMTLRTRAQRLLQERAPRTVDLMAIRQETEQLLDRLRQHKEAETDLVQESVLTDIGVGD
jgi:hypothetical protein